MAQAKPKDDEKPIPHAEKRSFKVWYRPGPEDRAETRWNGILFRAGTPVTLSLDKREHYVTVDMPTEIVLADGSLVTKSVAKRISMIELAKGNGHYEVEGFPRHVVRLQTGRKPQTEDQYRSWAMAWIQDAGNVDDEGEPTTDINTARQLLERWDDEEPMRERIGVGDDVVDYLKPFFDMKAQMLKRSMSAVHSKHDGGEAMGIKERYTTGEI